MNIQKTPFVVLVLAAVGYGAYVVINRKEQEQSGAVPGAARVQIPAPGAVTPQFSSGPAGGGLETRPGTPHRFSPPPAAGSGGDPAPFTPPAGYDSRSGSCDKLDTFMQAVERKLDEGRLGEAHLALSSWYENSELSAQQSRRVTELLDQLAGTVIYSRQFLLERPHIVQPGDSLEQIAQTYNVPAQLLANINGIRDPQDLRPGRQLKVVSGPFSALISLGKHELTLMLKGRYAGRFPIGVGSNHQGLEGSYVVSSKDVDPTCYGRDPVAIEAGDPNNPLRIGLKSGIGSQTAAPPIRSGMGTPYRPVGVPGTDDPGSAGRTAGRGSIRLGDQDIRDVFGILSIGSKVTIRR